MACDANSLMATAMANGYDGMSDRDLKMATLASACSDVGSVTSGTGAPSAVPASGVGLYIQTDSIPPGKLWEYYSGAWN